MTLSVDADAIRSLAAILHETNLTEIEIVEGESRIRVVRAAAAAQTAVVEPAAAPMTHAPAATPPAPAPPAMTDFSQHPGAVKSPMVGIAYLAPEPGAAPYVSVGQTVSAGQTLLLIEAMKTFNQIRAPRAGTVGRMLATTGLPVEFGEVLAVIE